MVIYKMCESLFIYYFTYHLSIKYKSFSLTDLLRVRVSHRYKVLEL